MAIAMLLAGSMVAGALGGGFYGFCVAAHHAASRGEVISENRLLRLMAMRTDNLSFGQAIVFLAAMAFSLLVFFGVMFTPAILVSWLSVPTGPEIQIAHVALFCAGFFGWHVGKRLWGAAS